MVFLLFELVYAFLTQYLSIFILFLHHVVFVWGLILICLLVCVVYGGPTGASELIAGLHVPPIQKRCQ